MDNFLKQVAEYMNMVARFHPFLYVKLWFKYPRQFPDMPKIVDSHFHIWDFSLRATYPKTDASFDWPDKTLPVIHKNIQVFVCLTSSNLIKGHHDHVNAYQRRQIQIKYQFTFLIWPDQRPPWCVLTGTNTKIQIQTSQELRKLPYTSYLENQV